MRRLTPFRSFAVAAVASSFLLSACGEADPDADVTPSLDPDVESSAPVSPDGAAPSEDASAPQESLPPQPTSTREPIDAGPLEGTELNDAGVAWFGAFCSGIGALSQYGVPDTEELSVEETAQAVGAMYMQYGVGFDAAAADLRDLDADMNFENAEAFATEAVDSIEEVGAVYTAGAEEVQSGSYSGEEDLFVEVRDIETQAVEAGAGDFGLSSLDESVFDAVNAQVPACANP